MNRLLKSAFTALALTLGLTATTNSAHASFVQANYINQTGGTGVTFTTAINTPNGLISGTSAGTFNFTQTGNPSFVPWLNTNFQTYCIDLSQVVAAPQNFNTENLEDAPVPAQGNLSTRGDDLRKMWAAANPSGFTSNLDRQAFQVAVWNIVYDTDFKVGGGNGADGIFGITNATIAARADYFLGLIATQTTKANLIALTSGNAQDQVTELKPGWVPNEDGDVDPVPAPAGLVLALCGVLPCVALRRRLLGQKAAE